MNTFMRTLLSILLFQMLAAGAMAQDQPKDPPKPPPPPPLKINSIHMGFQGYEPGRFYSKTGMWAPVQVTLTAGEDPIKGAKMFLEINDSEDAPTMTTVPVPSLDAGEKRPLRSYALPGTTRSELKVRVKTKDKNFEKELPSVDRLELSTHLILTLGGKLPDLHRALVQMRTQEVGAQKANINNFNNNFPQDDNDPQQPNKVNQPKPGNDENDVKETKPRYAAFETDPMALPDRWIGYQSVDLMILTTENDKFLKTLTDRDQLSRLKAIAQWVRRGGHLVISVYWNNQEIVSEMLANEKAWQPPLPIRLPRSHDAKRFPETLKGLEEWIGINNKPFGDPNKKEKIQLALLHQPGTEPMDWDVLVKTDHVDKQAPIPVVARVSYGLGSITFLAFSVDPAKDSQFNQWEGKVDFWKFLVKKLIYRLPLSDERQMNIGRGGRWEQSGPEDLVTTLHSALDVFDIRIVPFGWVALFILLYIVVVGPLDYLVLKYVFKRLEWTWITFPIVVFGVSFAAYFTAYAIKGKELRVNQVDILDIDMRTEVDHKMRPARAYIYGQTYFALLSPTIQNYTIGVEPNPRFWGAPEAKTPLSADMVSWLGKAGNTWGGMEQRGTQIMGRRPYYFGEPAGPDLNQEPIVGLVGVPITVWMSKAFTATWEVPLPSLPFNVDLVYHLDEREGAKITGKLSSNLPVDLEDVWLFYQDKYAHPLGSLPGKKGKELDVKIVGLKSKVLQEWKDLDDQCDSFDVRGTTNRSGKEYKPTKQIKQLFVFDKATGNTNQRNQWLKPLDMSWRLQEEKAPFGDSGASAMREAVIYARVRFRTGLGETLCADEKNPLPTLIWLGDLPGRTKPNHKQPPLTGNLNQDTYIRILVPLRPAGP